MSNPLIASLSQLLPQRPDAKLRVETLSSEQRARVAREVEESLDRFSSLDGGPGDRNGAAGEIFVWGQDRLMHMSFVRAPDGRLERARYEEQDLAPEDALGRAPGSLDRCNQLVFERSGPQTVLESISRDGAFQHRVSVRGHEVRLESSRDTELPTSPSTGPDEWLLAAPSSSS